MTIFEWHIWWFTLAPTWYGVMYAVSFLIAYIFFRRKFDEKKSDILLFYSMIGVVVGWRLGYVFIYNFWYFLNHPSEIFMPWKGGMSFHGGTIWVILAWYVASKKIRINFLQLVDMVVWVVPIGLCFWRIGNYINGELLGFPGYTGFLARTVQWVSYFPTPLFEAFWEGICLFLLLFWKKTRIAYPWELGVWFLGGYAIARFCAEFLRTPDVQIGYIYWNWLTLGHILSGIMLISALILRNILKTKK